MKYSTIYKNDISDGPGNRVGLYVQGCFHKCPDCFNKHTWDITKGKELTKEIQDKIFELLDKSYISGLSILGGDPLCLYDVNYLKENGLDKNYPDDLTFIIKECKKRHPEKTIWIWTGFLWEDFFKDDDFSEKIKDILPYIDVLIDGPFIQDFYKLNLKYRGSTNQRVIDVQESLKTNTVVTIL